MPVRTKCDPAIKAAAVRAHLNGTMSIRQAAKACGLSPSTIQEAVQRARRTTMTSPTAPPLPPPAVPHPSEPPPAVDPVAPPPSPSIEVLGKIPEAPAAGAPPINPCPPEGSAPAPTIEILDAEQEQAAVPPAEQVGEVVAAWSALRATLAQLLLGIRKLDMTQQQQEEIVLACSKPTPVAMFCLKANAPRLYGVAMRAATGIVPMAVILSGDLAQLVTMVPNAGGDNDPDGAGADPSVSSGDHPAS